MSDGSVHLVIYLGGEHASHLAFLLVHAEAELEVFLAEEEAFGEQGAILLQQRSVGIEGAAGEEGDGNVTGLLDVLDGLLGIVVLAQSPFLLATRIPHEVAVAVVADEGRECQVVGMVFRKRFQLLEEICLDDGVVVEQQVVVGLCRGNQSDGSVVALCETEVLANLVENVFMVRRLLFQLLTKVHDAMQQVLFLKVCLNPPCGVVSRPVVCHHTKKIALHTSERVNAFERVGCTIPVEHDDGSHTSLS